MFRAAEIGLMWVPVQLPAAQEGGEDPVIWLHMRLFTRAELRERQKSAVERVGDPAVAALRDARNIDDMRAVMEAATLVETEDLAEVAARVRDWRGIEGEDGTPQPFTAAALDALLAHQWFATAVREALFRASREGVPKNSLPGSAGMPARVQA